MAAAFHRQILSYLIHATIELQKTLNFTNPSVARRISSKPPKFPKIGKDHPTITNKQIGKKKTQNQTNQRVTTSIDLS